MFQSKIKDIFFDLDHTIWDFDANSEKAFEMVFKKYHPAIPIKDFVKVYMPINQACWKLYQVDKITHEELRYNRLKQTFDLLNYPISDLEMDVISEEYIQFLPEFNHLFADAHEVLGYLKSKYNLHIITNGFASIQDKKIGNAKIGHYFQTITNSEMAGAKKPNPVIFEHALALSGANKANSIMIGDSFEADILGALDFGMQAIFFNSNQEEITHDVLEISTLAELKKLF
jgi:YjjG family noncanonical pyrimidine nucleotidase